MLSHVEISKKNLEHNIKLFKHLVKPNTKLVGVVKANAYGHGVREVVKATEKLVDYFQVDDMLELIEIRQFTDMPVLVLGYVESDSLSEAIKLDAILSIYDVFRLKKLDKIGQQLNKVVKIHLKIDAFLGRQGVLPEELDSIISLLKKSNWVKVEALYSHFANIEDTTDFTHALKQIEAFEEAKIKFKTAGFNNLATHFSASSGILVYEQITNKSDIVRLGLAMYGMWPSEELERRYGSTKFELRPVIRWVTRIAQVKTLKAGHSIGYGLTYVTSRLTKVAIIPQGYSDGYDRGFSNIGQVLINGTHCPILGRVAMNIFVVDVSHLKNVKQEDEVVLLGQQGKIKITAEDLAKKIGTINYEITTRIWPKLPRILN